MTGTEQVLIEDWCQQYPSHSVGDLVFGADGALYVSGGDGASFNFVDYGQDGVVPAQNPCGDPPGGVGGDLDATDGRGRGTACQDLRTSGDPVSLDGTILRVDPATGDALPNNPLIGNPDPNARRIVAYGLRNPFRQTLVPAWHDEVWVGDVGWGTWEEINRIANPTDSTVENFGWPCYEGNGSARRATTAPTSTSARTSTPQAERRTPRPTSPTTTAHKVVAGETLRHRQLVDLPAWPSTRAAPTRTTYDDALFFADYSRDCIWVMEKGANGLPDPAKLQHLRGGGGEPGRPGDRPGRRPLLRRLRRRYHPSHTVHSLPTSRP